MDICKAKLDEFIQDWFEMEAAMLSKYSYQEYLMYIARMRQIGIIEYRD